MILRARPYSGPADLPRIFGLLLACQRSGTADAEFRSIELRILLTNPNFDADRLTLLLEDDADRLVAFAVLWQGKSLGMLIWPDQRGIVEDQVIDWAEDRVAGMAPQLVALCRDDDRPTRNLLERHGFRLDEFELRMVRDLHQPIPEPVFPEGFKLRTLDSVRELDDWLDLYRDTIGDRPAILQRWRRARADPDYDPLLDLIAVDEAGNLAAMCYCSIPLVETTRGHVNEGRTEPIAVAAQYRRQGLGRAMVLSGLQLLRLRGMDQALLTTEVDNLPAHRLYESLGYQLAYRGCWYVTDLD